MSTPPFATSFAINALSFGNVSIALLREMYKRGLNPALFPITPDPRNPFDLSTQKDDPGFTQWLCACHNSAQQRHSRKHATIRLWHINDSIHSYSERGNNLLTFFELDSLTPCEINVLRQQNRVYVTSRYTQTVFGMFGVQSEYLPLGFDAHNFSLLPKRPAIEGAISFLMAGKWEARKGHPQVLRLWAKRYGNNKDYRLNCAVHNGFLPPGALEQFIGQALEGKRYNNINFLPWASTNAIYNQTLQSSEIVIAMSGGEGRDLPCYHATAMGAWPVAMRAHAYLDYLADDTAVLVNPNGKRPAADGVHFAAQGQFNVGNLFVAGDDDIIAGFEEAERRAKTGLNKAGLELQNHTYAQAVDILLKDL
jgi:glycosyltransferase involved in cell wall biosynthesis